MAVDTRSENTIESQMLLIFTKEDFRTPCISMRFPLGNYKTHRFDSVFKNVQKLLPTCPLTFVHSSNKNWVVSLNFSTYWTFEKCKTHIHTHTQDKQTNKNIFFDFFFFYLIYSMETRNRDWLLLKHSLHCDRWSIYLCMLLLGSKNVLHRLVCFNMNPMLEVLDFFFHRGQCAMGFLKHAANLSEICY